MLKLFTLAALAAGSLSPAMAGESKEKKAPVKEANRPAKLSPSFARWIEREKLAAPKSNGSWISGDVGVRVLAIRR